MIPMTCVQASGAWPGAGRCLDTLFICQLCFARIHNHTFIALHEDWGRSLRPQSPGYLLGELLHDIQDLQVFLAIARYESEAEPACAAYRSAWCDM
jgi:hypothetical protein